MNNRSKSERRSAKTQPTGKDHPQSLHASSQARVDDIIIVPTRQAAPTISLSSFLLLVASFVLFKAGCIAWIGAEAYAASIAYLKSGTVFEQAAAFVMTPDVLSQGLANQIQGVLP